MMKRIGFFSGLILVILLIPISACSNQDSFYEEGSGWDYLRFPLLKPYYAIYIDNESGWGIPLQLEPSKRNFLHYLQIQDVRKIAIDKGIIMVYTPFEKPIYVSPEQEKELHWFILIPDQAELGFETEEEFTAQIKEYDIGQPLWQEPKSILQTYDQTGCLNWIPGCD